MSDVIDFLERMGQDASLRHGSVDEMELALANAQLEPELQSAILADDLSQLHALLGRSPLYSMQVPAEEDEEEGEGEGDEDGGMDEDALRKGEGVSLQSLSRHAAQAV